jgi:hypothetical protein
MEGPIEIVVRVTDDLKMMAGQRPSLENWARCYAIRELVGVDEDAEDRPAGLEVTRFVLYNINGFQDGREFEGRWREADQLKPAFKRSLGLDSGSLADVRRGVVMAMLKFPRSKVTWRKDREWKFLYILAEAMTT